MSANSQALIDFAADVAAAGRDRADDVEVWAVRGTSHSFRIENRRIFPRMESQKVRIGLRILRDGGLGYAALMRLDREEARRALDKALQTLRPTPLTAFGPCTPGVGRTPCDERLAALRGRPAEQLDLARRLRDRVFEEAGEQLGSLSGSVSLDIDELAVATRAGAADLSATALTAFAEADSVFYDTFWATGWRDDWSELTELGVRTWREASRPAAAPEDLGLASGTVDVVLHPRLLESLVRTLGSDKFSGSARLAGLSELQSGVEVADPSITLVDDASASAGLLVRPVDDEGTPCRRHVLIDGGRFSGFLHDRSSAIRAGVEPTGHGYRRPLLAEDLQEAPVRERLSQLSMEPGARSLAELLGELGSGLLVYDLLGLHTADRSRAAFSCAVFCGFTIEGGRVERRLAPGRWNLSGSLFDVPGGGAGFLRDVRLSRERVRTGTAELPYVVTRLNL